MVALPVHDLYDDVAWDQGVETTMGTEPASGRGPFSQQTDAAVEANRPKARRRVPVEDLYDKLAWEDGVNATPRDEKTPGSAGNPQGGGAGASQTAKGSGQGSAANPQGGGRDAIPTVKGGSERAESRGRGKPVAQHNHASTEPAALGPVKANRPEQARQVSSSPEVTTRFAIPSPAPQAGRKPTLGGNTSSKQFEAVLVQTQSVPVLPVSEQQQQQLSPLPVPSSPSCTARSGKDSTISAHTGPPSPLVGHAIEEWAGSFDNASSLDSLSMDLRRCGSQPVMPRRAPQLSLGPAFWGTLSMSVEEWDEQDVVEWVSRLGPVPADFAHLIHQHAISGTVLMTLSTEDIEKLSLKFGYQRLLVLAAHKLRSCADVNRTQPSLDVSKGSDSSIGGSGAAVCGTGLGGSFKARASPDGLVSSSRRSPQPSQVPPPSSRTSPPQSPFPTSRPVQQFSKSTSERTLEARSTPARAVVNLLAPPVYAQQVTAPTPQICAPKVMPTASSNAVAQVPSASAPRGPIQRVMKISSPAQWTARYASGSPRRMTTGVVRRVSILPLQASAVAQPLTYRGEDPGRFAQPALLSTPLMSRREGTGSLGP